jgi:precorrin-2 dehydrogenase/sirohydrochlorin ferrochelatase
MMSMPARTLQGPSKCAYPMLLDVTSRRVVIVGGGEVAARKASGLLDAGAVPANIRVVAPEILAEFAAGIQLVREAYQSQHLQEADLVFAATDSPAVNEQVVRDAERVGALVCRVDVDLDAAGDFVTPAKLQRGPLLLTVAAGGNAALAAAIRDELSRLLDPRWDILAAAMQILRPDIRNHPALSAEDRKRIFRELASKQLLEILEFQPQADEDRQIQLAINSLRAWLSRTHPQATLD